MGHATRGNMYCDRCDKTIAAVKTTHGVRNFLAFGTLGATAKVEPWVCPDCGGKALPNKLLVRLARAKKKEKAAEATRQESSKPRDNDSGAANPEAQKGVAGSDGGTAEVFEKIRGLSQLRDEGLLTEEEFQVKKSALLDQI